MSDNKSQTDLKQLDVIAQKVAGSENKQRITREEQDLKDRKQFYDLRAHYAKWLFRILVMQIIILDVLMLCVGFGWLRYQSWIFEAFITGTIIQAFGSAHIIVQRIFSSTE